MLEKSEKYGTSLTAGPRLQRFIDAGLANDILWQEGYPNQEKPTADGRGQFQHTREWIEIASLENIFDLWCRGRNLIGFAGILLHVTETFKKLYPEDVTTQGSKKRRKTK